MAKLEHRLAADQRGATSVEYALLVAIIALSLLGATTPLVKSVSNHWGKTSGTVGNVTDGMPT